MANDARNPVPLRRRHNSHEPGREASSFVKWGQQYRGIVRRNISTVEEGEKALLDKVVRPGTQG